MEIRELNLKHYGKFENHRIRLQPGINIIYGRNETGKSTIHSFIRAMFFGLQKGRGRSAKPDEYSLRQPWENPGYFAGSMRVEDDGESYRIDRNFDKGHESLSVVCESRGEEAADGAAQIGQLLGGMNDVSFGNTVFVRQARAETDEALMEELRGFLVNYDSALERQTDVSRALQKLQKKKKQFVQQKKAEEERLEEQIRRRQTEADYIRREIEGLRGREESIRNEPAGPDADANEETDGGNRGYRIAMEALLVAAAVLAAAGAFLLPMLRIRIFLGVFAVVFLALLFPVHLLLRDHSADEGGEGSDEREWRLGNVREEIQTREDKYQKLQSELELLYQNHVKMEGIEIEIEALNLAVERISGLSAAIFHETGGGLNERASEILAQLTGGRYTRVSLDDSAQVRVQSRDRLLHLWEVSYGTMQQIYFALRMAAGELLAKDKPLPLILDEPFAMYDDARLTAALRWLDESGRQVILFTCQERERKILERIRAAAAGE